LVENVPRPAARSVTSNSGLEWNRLALYCPTTQRTISQRASPSRNASVEPHSPLLVLVGPALAVTVTPAEQFPGCQLSKPAEFFADGGSEFLHDRAFFPFRRTHNLDTQFADTVIESAGWHNTLGCSSLPPFWIHRITYFFLDHAEALVSQRQHEPHPAAAANAPAGHSAAAPSPETYVGHSRWRSWNITLPTDLDPVASWIVCCRAARQGRYSRICKTQKRLYQSYRSL